VTTGAKVVPIAVVPRVGVESADQQAAAVHEAGHAVVAQALGWPLMRVSVRANQAADGQCFIAPPATMDAPRTLSIAHGQVRRVTEAELAAYVQRRVDREQTMIGVAGDVAVEIFHGRPHAPLATIDEGAGSDLWQIVFNGAGQRFRRTPANRAPYWTAGLRTYVETRRRQARRCLERRWHAVETLATVLLAETEIDGERAAAIIGTALAPRQGRRAA
jgi:hypothetical protein